MIRHTSTRRTETVSDAVGCMRAFGSLFVLSGSFALGVALLGLAGMEASGVWVRIGVGAIGATHLAGGLLVGWSRTSRAVVSRSGVVWTERRPFRGTSRRSFAPSEIAGVGVSEETDSDGDGVYRVVLALRTGEWLPLTHQTAPVRRQAEAMAHAVSERLAVPRLGSPQTDIPVAFASPEAVPA